MDKITLIKEWVKNLKSGEYKIAHGTLKNKKKDKCYCVQGLLVESYHLLTGVGTWEATQYTSQFLIDTNVIYGEISYLDLLTLSPEFVHHEWEFINTLPFKNDSMSISFKEMASLIGEYFKL